MIDVAYISVAAKSKSRRVPNRELLRRTKVCVAGDGTTTVFDTDWAGQRCVSKYRYYQGQWQEWQEEDNRQH